MIDKRPIVHWEKKLSTNFIAFLWSNARQALLDAGKKSEFNEMQKEIDSKSWIETLKIMKKYVKFEGPYITEQQSRARR